MAPFPDVYYDYIDYIAIFKENHQYYILWGFFQRHIQ